MLIYFGWSAHYANLRYLTFETGAYDLGVYSQPLWNFINGNNFNISLLDEVSLRWGIHVEPILLLIAPLYALTQEPRLLMWLQIGAITLSAWPMYALAIRRIGNEWPALTVVLAFFLLPATQAVTLFDFHAVTFAPLFLLCGFYFLDRHLTNRGTSLWIWPKQSNSPSNASWPILPLALAYLFFILAMSTKEDIPLHVFMVGLYLLLRRQWKVGGSLTIISLIWFVIAFRLIIPAYRTGQAESIYVDWFETLGNTPIEIALSPLTNPQAVFNLIFQPGTIPALLMITAPLAFLPVAGFPFLLMSGASIAFVLLSSNPTLRQLESWHYTAPMLAFLMLATMDGLARLQQLCKSQIATCKLQAVMTIILLLTAVTYHYYRGYSPWSVLYEPLTITAHHELGHTLATNIPQSAALLAQAQLIPQTVNRKELAIWSGPLYTEFEYVWLDLSHHKLPNRFNAHGDFLTGLIHEPQFGFETMQDGYMVLKKGADRPVIPPEFFTFTEYETVPDTAQRFDVMFDDIFKLIAVQPEIRRLATTETEPQVILYLEVLQKPNQAYHLYLYRLDDQGEVVGATDYPQPALFWWPTSQWKAGDKRQIRVNTIPWWTGDQSKFGYAIGFSQVEDPWDITTRLSVSWLAKSVNPPASGPIDENTLQPIAAFERWFGLPYYAPLTILDRPDDN